MEAAQVGSVVSVTKFSACVMEGSPVDGSIRMEAMPVPESRAHPVLKSSATQTESGAPSPSVSVSAQSSRGHASAVSSVPSWSSSLSRIVPKGVV